MKISDIIAKEYVSTSSDAEIADIISFCESSWGAKSTLFPVQRFVLKMFYGIPLDRVNKTIKVTDKFRQKILYEFTEYEYLQYLYSQGRCNVKEDGKPFLEMAMVMGRRAGKCCNGATLSNFKGLGFRYINEILPTVIDEKILGLQNIKIKTRFGYKNVIAGISRPSEKVINLRTNKGYEFGGSETHPLLVMDKDGELRWKKMPELSIGDYLCIDRHKYEFGEDLEISKEITDRFSPNSKSRKKYKIPTKITPELGRLLGYLVGDGNVSCKDTISLVSSDVDIINNYINITENIFGFRPPIKQHHNSKKTKVIKYSCKGIRGFLEYLGLERVTAHYKKIPKYIRYSSKETVKEFLIGLFDTDGTVSSKNYKNNISSLGVRLTSVSSNLVREVQTILLGFGIISNRSKFTRNYVKHDGTKAIGWDLNIYAENAFIFFNDIGFGLSRKQDSFYLIKRDNHRNVDRIPYIRSRILNMKSIEGKGFKNKERSCKWLKIQENYQQNRISVCDSIKSNNLTTVLEYFSEVSGCEKDLEFLSSIQGIYFDTIDEIWETFEPTYDFFVPEVGEFVGNGIVSHNSTMTSLITCYEYYKILGIGDPIEYYNLMRGGKIKIINVANGLNAATEIFDLTKNIIMNCPILQKYNAKLHKKEIRFRTPWEIEHTPLSDGSIVGHTGGSLSRTIRGGSAILVVLDELAHMVDNGGVASSEKIYEALTPSVTSFVNRQGKQEGKIISLSSPLGRSGQLYKLYLQGMSEAGKSGILVLQIPTWEMNENLDPEYLMTKYKRNPASFMVEYGAEFGDVRKAWIKDKEAFKVNCIIPGHFRTSGEFGVPHFLGMDVGQINDGTAITIGHWQSDVLITDYSRVYYSQNESGFQDTYDFSGVLVQHPQMLEDIAREILEISKKFYIVKGWFDQAYGLNLKEYLKKFGVNQLDLVFVNRNINSDVYKSAHNLIIEGKVKIPIDPAHFTGAVSTAESDRFIKELFSLEETVHAKYVSTVAKPDIEGMVDDQSDSWARMCHYATLFKASHGNKFLRTYSMAEAAKPMSGSYKSFYRKKASLHGGYSERNSLNRRGRK